MYRIKCAGIYIIEVGDYYYIGKSLDVWMRWAGHYCDLKMNKHSSKKLQSVFNKISIENFRFRILEYVSKTEFKKKSDLKGKELDKYFNRFLLQKEKEWMKKFSINFALNENNRYFS